MSFQFFLSQVVCIALALVVFYLLKNYFPKYFEAKATNQATKEDIGKITEIVESIKTDLNKKTEELKAQLSLKNQHRINIKNAEREAFFDYNRKVSSKLYFLVNYNFPLYPVNEYEKLDVVFDEMEKRTIDLDLAESHLFLFYRDEAFLKLKAKLHIAIIDFQEFLTDAIFEYKKVYLESHFEIEAKSRELQTIYADFSKKRVEVAKDFLEKRNLKYSKVHLCHNEMVELICERLNKIEDEIEAGLN